jgi:DNA-binding IclR family transcriptional regulator
VLSLITEQPGATVTELANRMGIKAPYLYKLLPGLQAEGKVRKDGKGWHPADAK